MSARTVMGLLRKKEWSLEEQEIAFLLNFVYSRTDNEKPFSQETLIEHFNPQNLERFHLEDQAMLTEWNNLKSMRDFFQEIMPYSDFHYSRSNDAIKCTFLLVKNLLVYDTLDEYIASLKPGASLPEPIKGLSFEGYKEGHSQFFSNVNLLTDEYIKLAKSCFFVNGLNAMIDDIADIYKIKDISLLKRSTDYTQDLIKALNTVVDSLRERVLKQANQDKIKIFEQFIHNVFWEKTFPKPENVIHGRKLLNDFVAISRDRTTILKLYCS